MTTKSDKGEVRLKEKYDSAHRVRGRWREVVFKKMQDGSVKQIEDSGWQKNAIVVTLPKLLAGLMKNEPTFHGGILFHAIGEGNPSWDISPVPPNFNQTTLTAEYFRKAPDSIAYLDQHGTVVPIITNAILIRTTIDFGEGNGQDGLGRSIREHGLFGGNATAALNSGFMIDVFHRRIRWKDPTIRLVLFIELIL